MVTQSIVINLKQRQGFWHFLNTLDNRGVGHGTAANPSALRRLLSAQTANTWQKDSLAISSSIWPPPVERRSSMR